MQEAEAQARDAVGAGEGATGAEDTEGLAEELVLNARDGMWWSMVKQATAVKL